MSSFSLFGGDESITLIEYKDDKGEFKTFDAAKKGLDEKVLARLEEYKKDAVFVKDLRYVVNAGRIVQRPSEAGSAIESCSAQPCSSSRWENRGFDSCDDPERARPRSVCRDGDVDGSPSPRFESRDLEAGGV